MVALRRLAEVRPEGKGGAGVGWGGGGGISRGSIVGGSQWGRRCCASRSFVVCWNSADATDVYDSRNSLTQADLSPLPTLLCTELRRCVGLARAHPAPHCGRRVGVLERPGLGERDLHAPHDRAPCARRASATSRGGSVRIRVSRGRFAQPPQSKMGASSAAQDCRSAHPPLPPMPSPPLPHIPPPPPPPSAPPPLPRRR
jgi:hypothetical protein